jgi:replicative DNA helicase
MTPDSRRAFGGAAPAPALRVEPGRVPPQAEEAEKAILGSMLLSKDAVGHAVEIVRSKDAFYIPRHREIWSAMMALYERNHAIDLVTVSEELRKKNLLESCGGYSYLTSLDQHVASPGHVEHYCKIVLDKWTLRRLMEAGYSISDEAFSQTEEVDDLLDRSEQKIFEIANDQLRQGFVPMGKLVLNAFSAIEEYRARKVHVTGIPSGYVDLDEMTAGFQKADLVVVAGRPSMGKTSFALNIAENIAAAGGRNKARPGVAIFSLEMSKESLVQRLLCSMARVDIHKIRRGYASHDEYKRLQNAAAQLHDAPIFIDDSPSVGILEMKAKARRLAAAGNLGIIFVDYMQMVRGPSRAENRQQEMSAISRSMKIMAKELNVPVVALSQLSRAVEMRGGDKRPMLSDLRESGAIEQDADVVLFVYRHDVYETEAEKRDGKAEIIIAKQRNGPTGSVDLAFLGECTRFDSLRNVPEPRGPQG